MGILDASDKRSIFMQARHGLKASTELEVNKPIGSPPQFIWTQREGTTGPANTTILYYLTTHFVEGWEEVAETSDLRWENPKVVANQSKFNQRALVAFELLSADYEREFDDGTGTEAEDEGERECSSGEQTSESDDCDRA
jgi:hypothetical protein